MLVAQMESKSLQFEFRIKAISSLEGKVGKAKVSFIKQCGDYESGRWGLANEKLPKIYILRRGKEILYVGITKMPLSKRFRYGLTASGKKGYHGYAWKELAKRGESGGIDLFVYLFNNAERTEAIEAEVVYLIRNKTGRWPKYQTEIHFHQADNKEKGIAHKIYNEILGKI
ncbi:MAG: hypothetical protein HYW56_00530 [Candidatus Harrisonbacteria bacterium]|nr:hypothetical protein [Candidatus Harrisonbacteria bacterium]